MRKFFYGFLIFIAAALVSLPFINWQSLKQPVLNKLQSITGCEIEIKGPVHIHLFPTPKIVLEDAFIKPTDHPIGNESYQLVSAQAAKLNLSWAWGPLLTGKFNIHYFDLIKPVIVLKSQPSLKKSDDQASASSPASSNTSALSVHNFSISSGQVVIDGGTAKQTRIDNITLSGFVESLNGPAEMAGALNYNDMKFDFKVNVAKASQTIPVKGSVTVALKDQTFPLSFDGFLDKRDKKFFKTHLIVSYEGNTVVLDSASDFEKDQTSLSVVSKQLKYKAYKLSNLKAALRVKGSEVFFDSIEAEAYEGKLMLKGHLPVNKKLALQGHLYQLNLVKVPGLEDSPLKKGRLESIVKTTIDLTNTDKCLGTLAGTVNINVTEGAVETIDVEALTQQVKKIKDIQSLAEGLEVTKKRNVLNIRTLKADFTIDKGIATTKNLEILADPVDITGQGSIDIGQTLLNLMLKVHVKALGNLIVPFKITGNWNSPEYGIDQEQFGALITKSFAQHTVDKAMSQVRKRAQEALSKNVSGGKVDKSFKPEKVAKEILGQLLS